MPDLRYPIGPFAPPRPISFEHIQGAIGVIEACPAALRNAVRGLDATQLDTPYREGGWTVRQVVHHLPDSHMNAYIRTKLALTEEHPAVKPYNEAMWAELADARTAPIDLSLTLLDSLHGRWVCLLRSLEDAHFRRPLFHPEHGDITIALLTMLYEWHCLHHVAHITSLRARNGW